MNWRLIGYTVALMLGIILLAACAGGEEREEAPTGAEGAATVERAASPAAEAPDTRGTSGGLVQPTDLTYLGAFRLPDGPEGIGWEYSGSAMAYYPDGDPDGPDDGYPGSIFGTGHDWNQYVSEISIPVPVVSPGKNLDDLDTATTLQEFQNIRGDLFGEFEIPRVGLQYLPAQGEQTSGKLYFCWAQHMGEGETNPSHGWAELDLSNPQPAGPWRIGDYWNYVTTDYILAIPQEWADANTPGMYLATGRFRDGGQGARGPSLLAYGPWNEGNPPAPGSTLPATPLLLYTDVTADNDFTLDNYQESDEWSGGAWLTAGDKSAVIFVGTKGQGNCWYGNPDGPCLDCENRGWWSDAFVGQILFYDPADLAAVARGDMEPHEPQPYATLDIDEYLYHVESSQQKYHVGAASFDRERGLLYVFEPLADADKSLVHVWQVAAEGTAVRAPATRVAAPTETPGAEAVAEETEQPERPEETVAPANAETGDFGRVILLHHSVGANLIAQGDVRQRLTDLGYEFYDHGYNEDGLVLADGTSSGGNFDVPDDNTDPDGLANIFAQPLHDPPDNTFSELMQYDVIAFKSCFPTSNIQSDEQLADYKSYYLSIRDRMDEYPNKIFIVVTQPPEIPNDTDSEAAARARAWANWMASDEYLSGHPNVFTFNLFDRLADPSDNMLRAEYQTDESDAHPNELANQTIGPLFADFVDQAVTTYAAQ
jgi:hypothetical protein